MTTQYLLNDSVFSVVVILLFSLTESLDHFEQFLLAKNSENVSLAK